MPKWADWVITDVQYNLDSSHVVAVMAAQDLGESLGGKAKWSRIEVVNAIKTGTSFCTAFPSGDGKLNKGAVVEVVRVGVTDYLRTDANKTASDNLGNLPKF